MKVSDFIVQKLVDHGVRYVFELPGGMIAHLLDSLTQHGQISVITFRHEQGAAFAADGFGRIANQPAVAMATSGPGATNLITGIGSCYFDSVPAVFITGQVNRYEQKGDRGVRQLGFQETDIVPMVEPITKAAFRVENLDDLPHIIDQAFEIATEGRPGPVLVDIPMDLQRSEIEPPSQGNSPSIPNKPQIDFQPLLDALQTAQKPLILAGRGVAAANAIASLRQFAAAIDTPVITSLLGVDTVPYNSPYHVGMLGSYGNRWANLALGESDLLIVIGSRLDIRQTGALVDEFRAGRKIFHIDVDASEINNRVVECVPILSNVSNFLSQFENIGERITVPDHTEWLAEIRTLRDQWPDTNEVKTDNINPNQFMHDLSQHSQRASAFVVDVGQHQMWAAQSLELVAHQRFITSGGMGAMGYALPAAIGATYASERNPVVMIAGDGGFQLNIQELQTIIKHQLPIKMVVLNNAAHGMVRQFQQNYFDSRYQSTVWGYDAPNFEAVAAAYGIPAKRIAQPHETAEALQWLWADPQMPALLEVMIDQDLNAYPKIAFGRPITEMEPFATSVGFEST